MIKRALKRVLLDSIASRLAVLFAFASAMLFAAIGFYLYDALAKELAARNQDHLTSMTELARHALVEAPSLDGVRQQPELVTHLLVGHDLRLWIYGAGQQMLFSSTGRALPDAAWLSVPEPPADGISSRVWHDTSNSAYRIASARVHTGKPGLENTALILAMDVSEEVRVLRKFKYNLLAAMAAGALFAALISFLIASRGLRPVVRIAETAQGITASHLEARLEAKNVPRELTGLVDAFNTMFARLEDSFRRLADFSADLAHELRTPLTNILAKSQVMLSKARTVAEYREVVESNVEDMEHLSRVISDMLFLAQADRTETALHRETVDLRAEGERVAEFFSVACEDRGISIVVHGEATAYVDRLMMRRAISNLVSNAIRHSPDGDAVDITFSVEGTMVRVSVVDRGSGITSEHQSRIFDRFYRADASRSRMSGGTGLGLAIVRSIAKVHGGDVSISSEPGKATVFSISLPSQRQST